MHKDVFLRWALKTTGLKALPITMTTASFHKKKKTFLLQLIFALSANACVSERGCVHVWATAPAIKLENSPCTAFAIQTDTREQGWAQAKRLWDTDELEAEEGYIKRKKESDGGGFQEATAVLLSPLWCHRFCSLIISPHLAMRGCHRRHADKAYRKFEWIWTILRQQTEKERSDREKKVNSTERKGFSPKNICNNTETQCQSEKDRVITGRTWGQFTDTEVTGSSSESEPEIQPRR